ncbi:hypothetical protein HHK36_001708 [Tetracentron sinense]|uniref:Uncharacterized protein n=1 Tax=Tetracentron sinense TaxID=13715 RepID=A0A835DRW1_TETSI|nr:hypothetical protein HHK36_001708 [Tetracentron sinense]
MSEGFLWLAMYREMKVGLSSSELLMECSWVDVAPAITLGGMVPVSENFPTNDASFLFHIVADAHWRNIRRRDGKTKTGEKSQGGQCLVRGRNHFQFRLGQEADGIHFTGTKEVPCFVHEDAECPFLSEDDTYLFLGSVNCEVQPKLRETCYCKGICHYIDTD